MFEWCEERGKDVDHETVGFSQDVANFLIDQGVEDDRPGTVGFRRFVDLLYHGPRFFRGIDIGASQFGKADGFELCEQTLTQGFGCDAGAIGDEESRSFHRSWGLSRLLKGFGEVARTG